LIVPNFGADFSTADAQKLLLNGLKKEYYMQVKYVIMSPL